MASLKKGGFVVLYDSKDREGEADILLAAEHATPKKLAQMREFGGGLMCVAVGSTECKALGLPFLADILASSVGLPTELIIRISRYGDKSAFSLPVNHNSTFTGVTDEDRTTTMVQLAKFVAEAADKRPATLTHEFAKHFKAPGHVQLLRSSGLAKRKGHTEMSVKLAELAGITRAIALCEILDGKTGKAATVNGAKAIAKKLKAPFVEGRELTESLNM
jgi:3,4-dihydroxy 2-butanone 4-phosphate synthase